MNQNTSIKKFVFFGTPQEAVYVLDSLKSKNILPSLIVCSPDKKVGRHQILTSPQTKVWAIENNIKVFQPNKINDEAIEEIKKHSFDFFVVAAYGKILPEKLLNLSSIGTINVHPSLLPKYRGPSPIEYPFLSNDRVTGVSIMELDKEVDHGPIIYQETYEIKNKENSETLAKTLFTRGGEILADIIPNLAKDFPERKVQNHSEATFTHKLKKEDGEIRLSDKGHEIWNKFRAYTPWPGIFYFDENNKRVKVTDMSFDGENMEINKVIPEGKKEVDYKIFLNNK